MQKKLAALIAAGGPHLAGVEAEYDALTLPHQAPDQQQHHKLSGFAAAAGGANSGGSTTASAGYSTRSTTSGLITGLAGKGTDARLVG